MQFEESTIQDQLLKEFKPDDVCPMGAQLFTDTPNRVHQLNSNKHKSVEKVNYFEIVHCLLFFETS